MAHQRLLKPSFFDRDDLADLPPLVRLFFFGLLTQADRAGRLHDRPKRLKKDILPYDTFDPVDALALLEDKKFIQRYAEGDDRYLAIPLFRQERLVPNNAEPPSTLPPPPDERLPNHTTSLPVAASPHQTPRTRRGRRQSPVPRPIPAESPSAPTPPAMPEAEGDRTHEIQTTPVDHEALHADAPPDGIDASPDSNPGSLVPCVAEEPVTRLTDIQAFVEFADHQFQERYGCPLPVVWGRDGKLLKPHLKRYGLDALQQAWVRFLHAEDPFLDKVGRSIPTFTSRLAAFVVAHPTGSDHQFTGALAEFLREACPTS